MTLVIESHPSMAAEHPTQVRKIEKDDTPLTAAAVPMSSIMEGEDKRVKLISNDGQVTEVSESMARRWITVQHMLDDVDPAELEGGIPLPGIECRSLNKLVEFTLQYIQEPTDTTARETYHKSLSDKDKEAINAWNEAFFKGLGQNDVFDFILGVNFMDYKTGLDAACVYVAGTLKGKTPEEIRQMYNIKNDFTPEQEEKTRKGNNWRATVAPAAIEDAPAGAAAATATDDASDDVVEMVD